MEVSSFELIYKPQSPVGAADRVIQGYFLNITNLETTQLIFRLDFVTSPVPDPDRSLFDNTVAFIDTPAQNNIQASLVGGPASAAFRLSPFVIVPPNATAKVALLPSDPFPTAGLPANFEARGHVTLRLPPVIAFDGSRLRVVPQIDGAARVLLTPQNRATYLDTTGTINDQTQSSLPTASGAARDEVEAETGVSFVSSGISERISAFTGEPMPEFDATDVAMMLASLSASDADLGQLNAELKRAGIAMSVENRKT